MTNKTIYLGSRQTILLLITMIIATAILFVPSITTHHAKQEAWLSAIIATIIGTFISLIIVNLGQRFPSQTLIEYNDIILGPYLGKIVSVAFLWWLLHMNSLVIREFGSFLTAAFLPETPISVFIIVTITLSAYAVYGGIEGIARINEIFFPFVLIAFIILFGLAATEMRFSYLLPVFNEGILPAVKGAIVPSSWFGEIAVFTMLIPLLRKPQDSKKIVLWTILIIGLFFTMTVIGIVAIFGPLVTSKLMFPTLSGARMIHIANFIERVEALVMAIWVAGGFIKISIFYYIGMLGTAQLLKLKDYRILIIPGGIISIALSILIHKSILELVDFLGNIWPFYALIPFEIGMPLLLLLIAIVKGVGKTKSKQKGG